MPDSRQLAQDWFAHGYDDIQTVRVSLPAGGPPATAGFLLQQATEKYLKGYLISKGWKLRKTHNLTTLINEAIKYDESFSDFLDLARQLTAYFVESRYPADTPTVYSREEIADALAQTEAFITTIKEKTK